MHDTMLLSKISEALNQECRNNNISKVTTLVITVNEKSHVNEHNLYEHLQGANKSRIGPWTKINIEIGEVEDQTAILQRIQGEQNEG